MAIKLKTTTLDCRECFHCDSFPNEGECIDFQFVAPIRAKGADPFSPWSVYVRKEMYEVFKELVRTDRKQKQILIGSPGVGKSIVLFLVALHRTLYDDKPVCFIRKTRNSQELTSVLFLKKAVDSGRVIVQYSRSVDPDVKVKDVLKQALKEHGSVDPEGALEAVVNDNIILFVDGLHEGDVDLSIPHHYLSTSGGHKTPVGEAARVSTLVVLGGWQKAALGKALELTSMDTKKDRAATAGDSDDMHGVEEIADRSATADDSDDMPGLGGQSEGAAVLTFREETLDDIFYHAGGRIREALDYVQAPTLWKAEKKATINGISKEEAMLSLLDTKGNLDPKSAYRIRTMFRNEDGEYFGSAVQIVDSQYYARLLQDRVGLEDYYNAYVHAKNRGLSSAAGCHFEELLHQLFHKRPNPIQSVLESTGAGAQGLDQLTEFFCYWIPSIPNFANIDAALVIRDRKQGSVAVWCLQYTVSEEHSFNSRTFLIKFLRPLLKNFRLCQVTVKILFVVPGDVYSNFKLPQEVADSGYEGTAQFADCSSVEAVQGLFERLEFINKPVTFFDDPPTAQRARQ